MFKFILTTQHFHSLIWSDVFISSDAFSDMCKSWHAEIYIYLYSNTHKHQHLFDYF